MYLKAKRFLEQKQAQHVKDYGVEADVNSKLAEWMQEYADNSPEPDEVDESDLNDGHYIEAVDRIYNVNDIIENILLDHPVIRFHKEIKEKVSESQRILGEAYLMAGEILYKKFEDE